MNSSQNPEITHITLHNPSSCTCGRIIWLSIHCDFFRMNIGTCEGDTRIDARIGSVYRGTWFQPEALKETVNNLFWEMWRAWEPEEGIKVITGVQSTV
ncbi:hypothetical protein [Pantoea vagans]|uniref:hypothetical protein n=1 Tax=Pantoea vagans TaxID=470934 RepID=UPI0028E4E387|nr:hypothetical protein [Pantoea vagans]